MLRTHKFNGYIKAVIPVGYPIKTFGYKFKWGTLGHDKA